MFVASGTKAQIITQLTLALLWTAVLGFPVSWAKATGGNSFRWIGAQVSIQPKEVDISVPRDKVVELLKFLEATMARPVISKREMASLAGKLNFFAGLIPVMRPFLATLWATFLRKRK